MKTLELYLSTVNPCPILCNTNLKLNSHSLLMYMYINALKCVLTWIYCFVNNVAEIYFFFFLSLQRNELHAPDVGGEHHSLRVRSPAGLQYTGQYSRKGIQ